MTLGILGHLGAGEAPPVKKQIPPRAQCNAAVLRGEYPDVDTCLAAAAAGATIAPSRPAAVPTITDSPVVKYAGIALAAAVVLGGGYLLFKKDRPSMTPNSGLTKRQRAARRGAKTRASGSTKLWDVIRASTNTTVTTLVEPAWKSYDQVQEEAREKHGDVYVASKRKHNRRRRRR